MSRRVWLRPLSLCYAALTTARNALFDAGLLPTYKAKCAVLSIGNVSVGGNAKTPLTIMLARALHAHGLRPFIVSRGYGGTERGPYEVQSSDSAARVGDEPLLMQRKAECPVVISRTRALGVQFGLAKQLGNVAILDDGFQHRWLARDVDFVCVACDSIARVNEFVSGTLLPEGALRENRERALSRAHAIIMVDRSGSAPADCSNALNPYLPPHLKRFHARFNSKGVFSLVEGNRLMPQPVVALSAIARPEAFWKQLESQGFRIDKKFTFRDHHLYTAHELESVLKEAQGMPIVCTEKDAVRIPLAARAGFYELQVEVELTPFESFIEIALHAINQRAGHVARA